MMRAALVVLPILVGLITFVLARALRDTGAAGVLHLRVARHRPRRRATPGRSCGTRTQRRGGAAVTPHLRIWRQRDGLWRWRYVQPGSSDEAEVVVVGHRGFDSRDAAVGSARAAYPGLLGGIRSRISAIAARRWSITRLTSS
jgi:ubiquinol-cytochrome c reductase cytochrome b subunit